MQTSLYELTFKDGSIYRVFCANRKQNEDMLTYLYKNRDNIKRNGQVVVRNGIHTFLQFKKINK